jgi:hypothetical protein
MPSTPPPTKKNLAAAKGALSRASGSQRGIIDNVEKKLGPVAPGKHNDMRGQALLNWLKKDGGKVQKSIESKEKAK